MRISFENQTNLSRNIKEYCDSIFFSSTENGKWGRGGVGRGGSLNTDVFDY